MATIEFITKEDLEQFKQELFSELRRHGQKLHKNSEKKNGCTKYLASNFTKSRDSAALKFSKVGGLMFYKYDDVAALVD